MSQYDETSDGSFSEKLYKQEDLIRTPLRKPRTLQSTSEEGTDSPLPKSVLQKRTLRQNSSGGLSAGSLLASVNKAKQESTPQKFLLSPDAAVFVPRAITATPPIVRLPSVQDRLKKHNLSDGYHSNTKSNSIQEVSSLENEVENMQINNDGVKSIVETLETFVINLARDPGLYYKIQETFLSFLNPYFNDPKNNIVVISDTAWMLFMHSVDNPNFRYSGAKLCLTMGDYSPEFQANLHLLCEKDINSKTENLKGLLLFIAELYMNKIDNAKMFGNMLVLGFDVLLSTPSEDNVVAACQVIKLTGSKLSLDLPDNLKDILEHLEHIKPSMRNNIRCLIESVSKNSQIQLEETFNSDSKDLQPQSIPGMADTNTTPIFIGQDGIEIEDDLDSCDDDSDIEEMYVQYEAFLKEIKNK